jgi:quinol monooxygenase YgiN
MAVTALIRLRAKEGVTDELRKELTDLIGQISGDPDCDGAELFVSAADPRDVLLIEVWSTLQAHARFRSELEESGDMTPLIAMLDGPPGRVHYTAIDE